MMNAHTVGVSVVIALTLLGCNSLNETHVTVNNYSVSSTSSVSREVTTDIDVMPLPPAATPHAPSAPAAPVKKTESKEALCPPYKPLNLPAAPALPFSQLEATGHTDSAKLHEIERKHIEDLRSYIAQIRVLVQQHQQQYLAQCQAYLQQHR